MADARDDWAGLLERLLAGDRLAFLKLNRLISACLVHLRAYDWRDEWEDLRQEVILSLLTAARAGTLRDPQALAAFIQSVTRNKFVDRLKRAGRRREKRHVSLDDDAAEVAATLAVASAGDGDAHDVWHAVSDLSREEQQVLQGIYREGKTYEQVAHDTGIPLGTVKRRLRDGLNVLRRRFGEVAKNE